MVSFSLGHLKLERCGGTDTREETMRVKEEEMVVETEKNSVRNTPPTDSRRFSIDEEEKVNTNKETTETGKHQRAGETKKGDGIFLLYDTERKRSICALCHVLRGSIAGTAAKTVVYPLDRLKMHLQVKAAATGQTFRLSGAPHVVKELISQGGGLSALWKGNACAVVRAFPYTGLSFYTFDLYGSFLQSQAPLHPLLCRLIAGAAAGMTATVATYPLDVLNTRMAVTKHNLSYSQVKNRKTTYVLHIPLLSLFPRARLRCTYIYTYVRT
ncbi:mitochondrial carrier superfamily protein [Cystoisospora suis]|uniref:Mitochondrial carrier superfamily protein n=1 Tax=Cystoisospora suis TaxID=483139 RepID=A0A2C6KI91_9APIC|nr:mitochondrial carrier superfamily protein [Cystoisospora suis]